MHCPFAPRGTGVHIVEADLSFYGLYMYWVTVVDFFCVVHLLFDKEKDRENIMGGF